MTALISIIFIYLTNAHRANKLLFSFNSITLLCAFNFNGLLDAVNVLTVDLFIGSTNSGCILSLITSWKRLSPNCSNALRLSNINVTSINAKLPYFAIEQLYGWMTRMHQECLLTQICFHFDAYCRTKMASDVLKILVRYLFHKFSSFL